MKLRTPFHYLAYNQMVWVALQRADLWRSTLFAGRNRCNDRRPNFRHIAAAAVYRSNFFGAIHFFSVVITDRPAWHCHWYCLRTAIGGWIFPSRLDHRYRSCNLLRCRRLQQCAGALSAVPATMIEASMDLGANSFQTFRHVVLPNIATALLAGGMLAFALSFDEVIVTTFTAGQQTTLPIWIFSQLSRPRDRPVTNVVATIVILITFLPIFLAQKISAGSSDTEGETK